MSNVFTIQEVENSEILVPINSLGIERLLKVGARVKVRSDLINGKQYDGQTYLQIIMSKGKVLRIKETSLFIRKLVLEDSTVYSLEMLEGVYLN